MTHLTWADIQTEAKRLAERWAQPPVDLTGVYGVPSGGAPVACLVANHLGLPVVDAPVATTLVVDDLADSGATLTRYANRQTDALYRKPGTPRHIAPHATELTGWLVFPWEHDGTPTDAVVRLLTFIGEDPNREGLLDTPKRVTKAWKELTEGYNLNPADVLSTAFTEPCDEMVVLSGIEFSSTCEHHMLPFTGTATVGYIPNGKVVGLSKLARLTDLFARRLQIQERLTNQIAEALQEHTNAHGVGVIVSAHHTCMSLRGIRKGNTTMTTTRLLGAMYDDPRARAEFLTYHQP